MRLRNIASTLCCAAVLFASPARATVSELMDEYIPPTFTEGQLCMYFGIGCAPAQPQFFTGVPLGNGAGGIYVPSTLSADQYVMAMINDEPGLKRFWNALIDNGINPATVFEALKHALRNPEVEQTAYFKTAQGALVEMRYQIINGTKRFVVKVGEVLIPLIDGLDRFLKVPVITIDPATMCAAMKGDGDVFSICRALGYGGSSGGIADE